jgi:hypothetical protein
MSNYKDWIKAIDINVDYFSAFLKAWIAFNSWYRDEFGRGSDKEIIDKIKGTDNRYCNYINNLLTSQESDAKMFLENIARLHETLLNAAITTQEYIGVREQISFSEISVKNKNNLSKFTFRQINYEVKREHGNLITRIYKNEKEYLNYIQVLYDQEELMQQSEFISLSDEQKLKCLECYKKMKPYLVESVIYSGDETKKESYKKIGNYNFVNDSNRITNFIIVCTLYFVRIDYS